MCQSGRKITKSSPIAQINALKKRTATKDCRATVEQATDENPSAFYSCMAKPIIAEANPITAGSPEKSFLAGIATRGWTEISSGRPMKIGILGTRGIPNTYGGFEQFAQYLSVGLV